MTNVQTPEKTAEPGWQSQTFLVGEEIFLRGFVPGDENNAMSWRSSIFPKSPELVEKWIKEELPDEGEKQVSHLAIVRKSDDVVVGNIALFHGMVGVDMHPYVDVLYGDAGQRWLAEALTLVAHWQVDECFKPRVRVNLPGHRQLAIQALLDEGFEETARWREMVETHGERFDLHSLVFVSPAWLQRIAHPMSVDLPRSGNGEIRPVPAKVALDGDPPKQAVMIGSRVYLRPQDKKDAAKDIKEQRKETETFFDNGRLLNTEAQWESFLAGPQGDDHPGAIWFEVCLRENDEAIGAVGLMDVDYVNRVAETGSHFLNTDVRGKGYGFEAKHLLFEYAFERLGLHMVNSFVYFANTRSAAALRKQGYTEAGRMCWLYPFEGGFGNMVTFDLLADEWRALPRES